jgi:toxin YhaV
MAGRRRDRGDESTGQGRRPAVIHGWTVIAHPLFLDQLERLIDAVEAERASGKTNTANQKVLAGIARYAFDEIPRDPNASRFRLGGTLGPRYGHWRRAKFGRGRFRLFYRFRTDARIIVLAWVNDRETLRTRGARDDAYAVFARMLGRGNPPDDWEDLVGSSRALSARRRLRRALP